MHFLIYCRVFIKGLLLKKELIDVYLIIIAKLNLIAEENAKHVDSKNAWL
jgi:hypothetical protein